MLRASATITVIIPALNESAHIGAAVATSLEQGADEVIVGDGGSTDSTDGVAASAGATVIAVTPPQRARQMNAAAAIATGDVLVFLHADSSFRPGALRALQQAARHQAVVGGGFRRRYRSASPALSVLCWLGNQRAESFGWFLGDQAIWARRDCFHQLGGFPHQPLFEDLDFARRLARLGPTALITPGIDTSARRFDGGVLARTWRDVVLTLRHLRKPSASR